MVREEIAQRPQDIPFDNGVSRFGKKQVAYLLKVALHQNPVDNLDIIC